MYASLIGQKPGVPFKQNLSQALEQHVLVEHVLCWCSLTCGKEAVLFRVKESGSQKSSPSINSAKPILVISLKARQQSGLIVYNFS